MPGLAFYFEPTDVDVYSGRRLDLDAWNYAAKTAGDIDHFLVVNRTGERLDPPDADVRFTVTDAMPPLTGRVACVVCPWNECRSKVPLWGFDHMVSWYVFGPAAGWAHRPELGVFIPQHGQAALHAVHAATVVMAHRYATLHGASR